METTVNSFEKGMVKDSAELTQPQGSYRNAENVEFKDPLGTMSRERSYDPANITNYPGATYYLIGHTVLDNDIIMFHTNDAGSDLIGYVRNNVYNQVVDTDLGFSSKYQIDCFARKLVGDRVVYFTDFKNRPRKFNLDFTYDSLIDQIDLFEYQDITRVSLKQVITGGELKPGSYLFATRYLTADTQNATTFSVMSRPVSVIGEPDITVNKSVNLLIENVDEDFEFLEVAVVRYEDDLTPFVDVFTRVSTSIANDNKEIEILYTGTEEIIAVSTLEELNQIPVFYNKAKNIQEKDNTLFLSNLEADDINPNFEEVAKQIRFKYTIDEYPVSESVSHLGSKLTSADRGNTTIPNKQTTYDNPEFIYDNMGYMRDEVYSFSIAFVSNGYVSPAYHIPGTIQSYALGAKDFTSITANTISGYSVDQCSLNGIGALRIEDFKVGETCYVTFSSATYESKAYRILEVSGTSVTIELDFVSTDTGEIFESKVDAGTFGDKYLAPYFSLERYNSDTYNTTTVTHHKFPTLEQEPHFVLDGAIQKIRVMGIEVIMPLSSPEWLAIEDEIDGYIILREPRDNNNKKSILSQGIMINSLQMDDKRVADGSWNNFNFYSIAPFLGNTNIYNYDNAIAVNTDEFIRIDSDSSTTSMFMERFFHDMSSTSNRKVLYEYNDITEVESGNPYTQTQSHIDTGGRRFDLQFFFSPESVILEQELNPDYATNELKLKSKDTLISAGAGFNNNKGLLPGGTSIGSGALRCPYIGISDFEDYEVIPESDKRKINILSDTFVDGHPGGVGSTSTVDLTTNNLPVSMAPDYPVFNMMGLPYYALRFEQDFIHSDDYRINYTVGFVDDYINKQSNIDLINNPSSDPRANIKHLINLRNYNTVQYGRPDNAYYIPAYYQLDKSQNNFKIKGGDTYITKFAFRNYINLRSTYYNGTDNDNRLPSPRVNTNDGYDKDEGIETRHVAYFFVESKINNDLRHRSFDFENNIAGVDFYPNKLQLTEGDVLETNKRTTGLLDILPDFGNSKGYNIQYSLDSEAVQYYPLDALFKPNTIYHNRTIHSATAIEGETTDSMKVFLQNNFQDIPSDTGAITDTFLNNSVLYHRTPRGLWRTFVNEREALANDAGQIYLGNGGLFSLPAKQIANNGGMSKWASVNTPYGYVFLDEINHAVVMFSDKVDVISDRGLKNYFDQEMQYTINNYSFPEYVNQSDPLDNPVRSVGQVIGFDPVGERLLYTDFENNITLSYSFILNAWASFHNYFPQTYFYFDNLFYAIESNEDYYQPEIGSGNHFGTPIVSSVDFIVNDNPLIAKVFDSVSIIGYNDPFRARYRTNFNNAQDSGLVDLIMHPGLNSNIRELNDQFQSAVFRDTLNPDNGRMRGKYLRSTLYYNKDFELNSLATNYRINRR